MCVHIRYLPMYRNPPITCTGDHCGMQSPCQYLRWFHDCQSGTKQYVLFTVRPVLYSTGYRRCSTDGI